MYFFISYKILGSPEVFAGKPGKYYRNDSISAEGLVTGDWSRCVKNITLSSRDQSGKYDLPNGIWQSCGAQGKVPYLFFNCYMIQSQPYVFIALDQIRNISRYNNKEFKNGR